MTDDRFKKLELMDNTKLIDVVKNYRQYGYEEIIRDRATEILQKRGVDLEFLKMKGDLRNSKLEFAEDEYTAFINNSLGALVCYILSIFVPVLGLFIDADYNTLVLILTIVKVACILGFVIFFIRSLMNRNNVYKSMGKEVATGDLFIYFLVGMPLYLIMYFIYKNQMREEMKLIR